MSATQKIPHVLVIMDGIGHREDLKDNAFLAAHTPHLTHIKNNHVHGLISASGEDVGLPEGQFGNSEVGHMNLGAGRVTFQELTRIEKSIQSGDFYHNQALIEAVKLTNQQSGRIHLMGLLSDGGVHAYQAHFVAAARLALQQGATHVFIHAFLDGRDTPPRSAEHYVDRLQHDIDALNNEYGNRVRLVSLIGRYYAMDRDNRWERVQCAYDLMTAGIAQRTAQNGLEGVRLAYEANEDDEFVQATYITQSDPASDEGHVRDHDTIIFMNYRADRAREISQAFVLDHFTGFARALRPQLAAFVMLTHYEDELADHPLTYIAYPSINLKNTLAEYLARLGKTQLRIAETEKYAHVTFFFSGGREQEYPGETRILIPSPKVATYDLQPEMSAIQVTDELVSAIDSGQYDLLVVNYANGDMEGHTGDFNAAVKAVETVDACIGRVYQHVQAMHGHLLITADHGNVEQMFDYESNQKHTQHTTEQVPFIYVGNQSVTLVSGGVLADIAPTLLTLMNLPIPTEMTGKNLLKPI